MGARIDMADPDVYPDRWKKCGTCTTLLPVIDRSFPEWKCQPWHRRTDDGHEMCSECTEAAMDADQAATEAEEYARAGAEGDADKARAGAMPEWAS